MVPLEKVSDSDSCSPTSQQSTHPPPTQFIAWIPTAGCHFGIQVDKQWSFSSRANTTHWFYYLNVLASFLDGSKKIIFKYLWRCVQSLDHIKPWNLWLISGTPYTPWWNINHPLTHPPIQFPYSIPCPPSCSIRARTFASPFYARSQRRRKTWLTAALVSNPPPPLFVTATQPLFSFSQSIITIEKSITNYKKFANFIFLSLQ